MSRQAATPSVLGIAGAGVMGRGIAQCAAEAGLEVILVDVSPAVVERARQLLRDDLRLARMLNPSKLSVQATLARISPHASLHELARADFVIESISEHPAQKERVFRELDERCRPEVCLASNTSAIPIARLAAATRRAPQVLGLHVMNPATRLTVELVRAPETSDATIATARALLAALGKDCVEVRDGPGFVINRVLMSMINEAAALLAEGTAPAAEIDRAFTACLGHETGPLATADLIGLDVIVDTLEVLAGYLGARYVPHPTLVTMVSAGHLGRKSGSGFFPYPASDP